MKLTWSSACRGGGRGNLTSTKKLLAEVKEMNNLFASAVAKGKKSPRIRLRNNTTQIISQNISYRGWEKPFDYSAEGSHSDL